MKLEFLQKIQNSAMSVSKQIGYIFIAGEDARSTTLSYYELNHRACVLANYLKSTKAEGNLALLLYPPGLEFVSAFMACLYAGIIAIPTYPPRGNQNWLHRLNLISKDAQCNVVLTTEAILNDIKNANLFNNFSLIATDKLNFNETQSFEFSSINSEKVAFIQYTSGSTGKPKGVAISHENLMHNCAIIADAFGHNPNSKGVIWLPPYHDMGLIGGILEPIYSGFPVVLMPPMFFLQKPIRWLEAISKYQATVSGGPNFAYDLCVKKIKPEQLNGIDLSSWEVAFNGAEPVRASTIERFAKTFAPCGFNLNAFYPCYGMAEATLFVSGIQKTQNPVILEVDATALEKNRVVTSDAKSQKIRRLVGCGTPRLQQKILIVDPHKLTPSTEGVVGEIWVSGSSVAQGYWHHPEETQHTFQAYLSDTGEGAFLRTGDLGFILDDELYVTGRIKDTIIIRGRNHYPQDIELTVEKSHPSLAANSSAAFSIEMAGEERLVVVAEVERTSLNKLNAEEVIKNIRRDIANEHDLQVYGILLLKTARIPRSSSGKIARSTCRNDFISDSLDIVGKYIEQNTELEESQLIEGKTYSQEDIEHWISARLSLYLKIPLEDIDPEESFAEYGLDSSVAVSITGELGEFLGIDDLNPTLFWAYPSIEVLTQYLMSKVSI